jgi:hypothetical protein
MGSLPAPDSGGADPCPLDQGQADGGTPRGAGRPARHIGAPSGSDPDVPWAGEDERVSSLQDEVGLPGLWCLSLVPASVVTQEAPCQADPDLLCARDSNEGRQLC